MPQEKTYNAAALSTKSNAFGGSAVVSSFQVGFSARRRGQIFYLYRDNDTIAYERMTGKPGKIVFGWMFRPVLGRRSVSPGLRQLLAIVALPDDDCRGQDCSSGCSGRPDSCKTSSATPLVTSARTYWKKYDRGTLTSFEHRDANLAKKFWYQLSLTLAKPQIFHDRDYENSASYSNVIVGRSTDYENDLRPTVTSVTWRPNGAKNIIVSAQGNNFFSQTSVALGDKTYAEGSGLTLKSNQAFDLVTTIDALVNGPGTILGRYGNGVALTSPAALPMGGLENGVEVADAFMSPAIAGLRQVDIYLRGKPSDNDLISARQAQDSVSQATKINNASALAQARAQLLLAKQKVESAHPLHTFQLPIVHGTEATFRTPETPVVSLNGTPLDLPYEVANVKKDGVDQVLIRAYVKDSLVSDSGGGIVKVSWPFYPQNKWTATYRFYNPDLAFSVTRVSPKSVVISRTEGFGFVDGPEISDPQNACWKLIAGDTKVLLATRACSPPTPTNCPKKETDPCKAPPPPIGAISDFTVSATVADLPDKVALVAPSGSIYNLTVPALKAKDEKPAPIELNQFDSEWIQVKPSDLTPGPGTAGPTTAKPPDDFSMLSSVSANGKPVNYRLQKVDPKAINPKTGKLYLPAVVEIEVTRAFTSNPGILQVGFFAGTDLLGTRQIHITQTQWETEGDK